MENEQLIFAMQQLIGYMHAKNGFGIVELVEAMGLSGAEWEKIKIDGIANQLDDFDFKELEDKFK